MIGKSLNDRYTVGTLAPARAVAVVREMLGSQAAHLVQVRAQDARMIACLVVRADPPSVRLCRSLGFEVKRGGTGVFGLLGEDAAGLFPQLPPDHRSWLEAPCGPRETKVLLVAGGLALVSLETDGGKVTVTAVP
jgi:hypothetical protein